MLFECGFLKRFGEDLEFGQDLEIGLRFNNIIIYINNTNIII